MKKITLLMKTSVYAFCAFVFLSSTISFSQTNRVLINIDWPSESYEHKVEVYDPANNLLVSICNSDECYQTSGSSNPYKATYDLGCLTLDPVVLPNYSIKIYDASNNGWNGSASVTVNVAGVDVLTNDGSTANSTGITFPFNVNSTTYCTYPDTDGDNVIDFIDQDDDNDGILDIDEGLGLDSFSCAVPSLVFKDVVLDSGTAGTVGAIYRFGNALEGYDVLLEIVELDNTTISKIDNDTVDNADFLQSELTFTGTGTPGVTYKFTLVDVGTSTPSSTIYRIGGTTWDVDGTNDYQESVRYYNPSAYGLDNPTSLTADTYPDGAGVTAGTITYGGFSTNTILRSYFQFQSNTFNIRMQLKKTTSSSRTRLYAMSFTQCDIFDYKAPSLTVLSGADTDGDGIDNQLDLDSDNDGIPDNVEVQSTTGYIAPNNVYDYTTGIDTAYATGLTVTDTDGDNTPDFIDTDSDNDGIPDIEENGMADVIVTFTDDDNDGLDNIFETNGTNDASFDVNEDIENPSASILPDTDGDLASGGDLDYRDNLDAYYFDASLDFDGIDDYVDSDLDLDGMPKATIMGWVKLASDFGHTSYILNQGDVEVGLTATAKIFASINGKTISVPDTYDFDLNKWYHFTVIFDSSLPSDNLKLYVSGEFAVTTTSPNLKYPIDVWTPEKFTIGKEAGADNKYFKGAIDEVRVFNTALTEGQMHQIVHQEIENNSGVVKGKIVPKNIVDFNTNATIPWSALQVYYPMTDIISSKTSDYSDNNLTATLHNIRTMQAQTAPMPYATIEDGDWDQMHTWANGDVWDLSTNAITTPWSIIKVSHNMVAKNDINSHALIIDANKSITMAEDKVITNMWYLELNGTLDLQGDSQLVQGKESDLVTSADGKVLRRQEGNTNYFWYNYWSSPVGSQVATTLSENNGPANNTKNTPFSLNMLKDSTGSNFQFTNAYQELGKISRTWLYTFQNGVTYYDWVQINENTAIQSGFGYTQKGTGNTGTEQQYIFEGKPNNGTILVAADDVDGDSLNESEEGTTLTTTLIGNPYPSALDAVQFINDNRPITGSGVISGTIKLWEQWAGNTHYLADYEGGYAFINAFATERAYQHAEIAISDQVETEGIKQPTFTIPVGQGFFVEVIKDGDIEFNNGQRIFVKESDADGTNPNNGSVFYRTANTETSTNTEEANPFQLIRLEFATSEGSTRRFVLGFGEDATDGYDYGFDGGVITDLPADDMGSLLNGEQYVIQAFSPITDDKVVDLNLNTSGNFTYSIKAVELTNIADAQEIYLRDNLTNTYFDLTAETAYNFTSEAGLFTDRFDVVFRASETLATEEFKTDNTLIYVNQLEDKLYIKALTNQAKQLTMTNMLGQVVKTYNSVTNQTLENGIDIANLNSGVYIVSVQTENNQSIDKKVIIN